MGVHLRVSAHAGINTVFRSAIHVYPRKREACLSLSNQLDPVWRLLFKMQKEESEGTRRELGSDLVLVVCGIFFSEINNVSVIVGRGQGNKDDEASGCVSRCAFVCQHEYFRGPDRVVVTEHRQNKDILLSRAERGEEQERERW